MALSVEESATISRLERRHDAEIPDLELLDSYYEGTQAMSYMHPEIIREAGDRIRPVLIYWAQLAVDAIAERVALQGIKSGDDDLDGEFRRVWVANEMDLGLAQAVTDSLVMRRSYISVGTNEADADTPLLRPESPLEMYVDTDPRTRKGRAALRRTADVDQLGLVSARYATLYLPNQTIWCDWNGGWREVGRDVHNLGELPIGVLVNRPRTRSSARTGRRLEVERIGRSDIEAIRSLVDSSIKLATDMMVAAEFVAIPLRALFGVSPEDFVDAEGNPMSPIQVLMGRLVSIPEKEAKAYEFAAAQLQNFSTGMREMKELFGSVTGLPAHYMGTPSDNPASAEAITGSESRLATRAELKLVPFSTGVRNVARLQHRFRTGEWEPALDTCEMDWRNVRTPTVGARADSAQKLYAGKILPLRQTRAELGYSEAEIDAMEEQDEIDAAKSPSGRLAGALTDQGLLNGGAGAGQ